jgi:hypothetical protein
MWSDQVKVVKLRNDRSGERTAMLQGLFHCRCCSNNFYVLFSISTDHISPQRLLFSIRLKDKHLAQCFRCSGVDDATERYKDPFSAILLSVPDIAISSNNGFLSSNEVAEVGKHLEQSRAFLKNYPMQ